MTTDEQEALVHIQGFARCRDLLSVKHGRERSAKRQTTRGDVRSAILGATCCRFEPERKGPREGTYRVTGGRDLDGVALDVVVLIDKDEITGALGDVFVMNVLDP